jgi:hypothetical protein
MLTAPFVFNRQAKEVATSNDVIIGRKFQPENMPHILGNVRFWKHVRTDIKLSIETGGAWTDGIKNSAQSFENKWACKFWIMLPNIKICPLTDKLLEGEASISLVTGDLLQSYVRQIYMDVHRQLIRGEIKDEEQVINFVEARSLFLSKFEKGTMQNLLWRLWEEAPTRDDILLIVPLNLPTDEELRDLKRDNRNTYCPQTRTLTIRYFKTSGTFGTKTYDLSKEICDDLDAYISREGFHSRPNFPLIDGVKSIFGYLDNRNIKGGVVDNAVVAKWCALAGLTNCFPFTKGAAEDMFSAMRKTMTSLCDHDERIIGKHLDFKDSQRSFPTYDELLSLQLHGKFTADTHYNYPVRYMLKY